MYKKKSNNFVLHNLLKKINNLDKSIYLLLQAEKSINELKIYTIHEFCYQSLKINKFCSNILFQKKIITNEHFLYLKSSDIIWKDYICSLNKNIASIIVEYFKNPNILLKDALPLLLNHNNKGKLLTKNKLDLTQHYNKLIKKIKIFKKQWLLDYQKIFLLIKESSINKRSYNKKNVSRWINIITEWSFKHTINFNIPKELKYFRKNYLVQKTPVGIAPKDNLFETIENFLKTNFSLKTLFLIESSKKIKRHFNKAKKTQGTFQFDDLIQFLYIALNKKNEKISNIIKKKYPVLLIDEFQDTSYFQYEIFKKIYKSKNNLCIVVGDPKQAIYDFRGASISSYIQAKKDIDNHYQLNTNWRSSREMVESINSLFLRVKNVFLLSNITFIPTTSIYKKKQFEFRINGILQPALRFAFNNKIQIDKHDYSTWITNICVNYILFWINEGKKGNAVITYNKKTRHVSPKDICILVNNKKEAFIIQSELCKLNIKSVYLSQKNSVFHSTEALELLWIFQAILNPKNEFILKRAISTTIISQKNKNIDALTSKYLFWSNLINEFYEYLTIWEEFGITNVIHKIIMNYKIKQDTKFFTKNTPNISNILHVGELLEKQFNKTKTKYTLILWLEKKIEKKYDIPNQDYIKLKNSKNYIEIVTIHKSKGLEYPIVWIPFFINSCKSHHNYNFFTNPNLNIKKYKEILSENMRLLYVALTRAVVHCCIGIAPIKSSKKNLSSYSDIHKNALGYIVQSGKKCNYQKLYIILLKICCNKNIDIIFRIPYIDTRNEKNSKKYIKLENNKLKRTLKYNYGITSYSKLTKHYSSSIEIKKSYTISINKNININQKNKIKSITPYTFPKGKKIGIFIHKILKNVNFHKDISLDWLSNQLKKHNLCTKLSEILKNWINMILNTPLNHDNLILSKLNPQEYIKELEFFLPIKNQLTKKKLEQSIYTSNSLLKLPSKISFNPIKGIFMGSIDLIFKWNKKYYLIDYKSDWLGNTNSDYSRQAIQHTITINHYDLQYNFYSIALHRYLKQRIKNYSFNKYFGGIYILFLRAMNNNDLNKGLFFTLPKIEVIRKLNNLFI
ncbi:MAG: exodeoxyribonuclease V subunit beta [Buchnera aphidicola (Floraphis choui)]